MPFTPARCPLPGERAEFHKFAAYGTMPPVSILLSEQSPAPAG